jgi:hypothetical protein
VPDIPDADNAPRPRLPRRAALHSEHQAALCDLARRQIGWPVIAGAGMEGRLRQPALFFICCRCGRQLSDQFATLLTRRLARCASKVCEM